MKARNLQKGMDSGKHQKTGRKNMKRRNIWCKWGLLLLLAVLAAGVGVLVVSRSTDIPKLYFQGDIRGMEDKSDERSIQVRYEDGEQSFQGYAKLKVQGTSSLLYEKKNYTIKFYQDMDHAEKLKVDLGWGAESKYCLKANWIDRTHARNVVTAKLVSQMQAKYQLLTDAPCNGAVDGFPVEIYVNGVFHGLYTFNIPKDAWQFGMDSKDPNHIVISGENWYPANFFREEPGFGTWEVEAGEENDATLEKMKRLFAFVRNSSDREFVAEFSDYLDLDATLNYYIMADMAYLDDNRGKNMLLATYDGNIWYPSLYDLDSSWGAAYNGMQLYPYETEPLKLSESLLFERLEKHFSKELAQRYFELREEILRKDYILEEFEAFRDQIPELTFIKEYIRWGSGLIRRPEDLPGFEYDQIETFLDAMIPRLDAKYQAMLGE